METTFNPKQSPFYGISKIKLSDIFVCRALKYGYYISVNVKMVFPVGQDRSPEPPF